MNATIWRVECPDCVEGPYTCVCTEERESAHDAVSLAHGEWDDMEHPTPDQDGYWGRRLSNDSEMRCAFLTLEDARAWFGYWGGRLHDVGWVLYEVTPAWPGVIVLGKQVLYTPQNDDRVAHSPLRLKVC